jgi:hypothetical protein
MNIKGISKDALSICLSFLTEEELIYSKGEWYKFPKNKVCNIAARNGWLDLLKWAFARKNGCDWDKWVCHYAALNGRA